MNSGLQSALSGLLVAACLAVADTKMSFSDLPPPVRTAVKEQLRGAQIVGAGSEEEHGRTIYEVETMLNGKSRDLSFDAAGKLLEVEQQVDISGIPAAAKAALEKTSAGGSIRKVEMVTAGDSVSYEASVVTQAGKHREVAVNPDGTPHRD
jgi:uncharacterized membrane protein YkoI